MEKRKLPQSVLDLYSYEITPNLANRLFVFDKRITNIISYTEIPKSNRQDHIAEVLDWFSLDGYGTGITTTALVIEDFLVHNKMRLLKCVISTNQGRVTTKIIPIRDFLATINKTKPRKPKVPKPIKPQI